MALGTVARHSGMVHPPYLERAGVDVAHFAWLLGGKVIRRFAGHAGIQTAVASGAAIGSGYNDSSDSCASSGINSQAGMIVAFNLETGSADVARIAGGVCGLGGHMIQRLGSSRYSRTSGVATSTVFRSILEDAFNVALFASQG